MTTTHFRNGVSNALPGEALYQMGQLDPRKWITYFNDFLTAGDYGMVTTNSSWTITVTQAGAGSAAAVLIDGEGGLLEITNDAADNDAVWAQTVAEPFKWAATKDMYFVARFKVSDATQSDVIFGLQIGDTTPLDATDGIWFQKDDASTTMTMKVVKNSTSTDVGTTTLVADTYVAVGFAYTAADATFRMFVNDAVTASTTTLTNAPDDEELAISFGVQNGEAVAKVLTVDYIFAAQQRSAGPAV
jgi:hypothetical protein